MMIKNHGISASKKDSNNENTECIFESNDRIPSSKTQNLKEMKMISSNNKSNSNPKRRNKKIGRILRNSENLRFRELHTPVPWQVPVLFLGLIATVLFILDYFKVQKMG